jgi:hypothetical protein
VCASLASTGRGEAELVGARQRDVDVSLRHHLPARPLPRHACIQDFPGGDALAGTVRDPVPRRRKGGSVGGGHPPQTGEWTAPGTDTSPVFLTCLRAAGEHPLGGVPPLGVSLLLVAWLCVVLPWR